MKAHFVVQSISVVHLETENQTKKQKNKAQRPTMRPQEFLGHGKNWANLIHKSNFGHFSLQKRHLQTYGNLSTAIATFGGRHARELL